MLDVNEIERVAKERTKNVVSVTHDFSHLKRTAVGASWFVRVLEGKEEEQEMAYAAGLLHDIVRPASDICHAKASTEESEKILSGLEIDNTVKEKIVQVIRDHRLPVTWTSRLHQSVYLADKILEQMGALPAFRRCYYFGECKDYEGMKIHEAFRKYFIYRVKRINKADFPENMGKLVDYQWKWLQDFLELMNNQEPWAVKLGMFMSEAARNRIPFETVIRSYRPETKEAERYKKEVMDYIEGRKFGEFEKLVQ
jgi:HD superfamily phosphohydrolase YqeK